MSEIGLLLKKAIQKTLGRGDMNSTNFRCTAGTALMLATSVAYSFSLFGNDPISVVRNSFLEYSDTASIGNVFDAYQYCSNKRWEKFKTQRGEQIVQFSCVRPLANEEVDSHFAEEVKNAGRWFKNAKGAITNVLKPLDREDCREYEIIYSEITKAVKLNRKIDIEKLGDDFIDRSYDYPLLSYKDNRGNYKKISKEDILSYNRAFDECIKYQNFDWNAYYGTSTELLVQFAFIKNSTKDFKVLFYGVKTILPNVNGEHSWPFKNPIINFYQDTDVQEEIDSKFWNLLF